uniref:Uncharacterized protein n=1 Tax=Utricularia reniformis TaxID=192314 RepID=A0A1Y0B0F3_9LAMI|nr:hypothetical protein AEK19_MT0614 [Utricularia reniformis]ART30869.1 hypothetical protein AEK19_MT0614 [Utricularia reniformis]
MGRHTLIRKVKNYRYPDGNQWGVLESAAVLRRALLKKCSISLEFEKKRKFPLLFLLLHQVLTFISFLTQLMKPSSTPFL